MWIKDEIEYCQGRERLERAAANVAVDIAIHDAHFVMAERYADRAYSLSERADEEGRLSRMINKLRIV